MKDWDDGATWTIDGETVFFCLFQLKTVSVCWLSGREVRDMRDGRDLRDMRDLRDVRDQIGRAS